MGIGHPRIDNVNFYCLQINYFNIFHDILHSLVSDSVIAQNKFQKCYVSTNKAIFDKYFNVL